MTTAQTKKSKKTREPKPLLKVKVAEERKPARWTLPRDILDLVSDYHHYQIELTGTDDKRVTEDAVVEAILEAHFSRDRHFASWRKNRGNLHE